MRLNQGQQTTPAPHFSSAVYAGDTPNEMQMQVNHYWRLDDLASCNEDSVSASLCPCFSGMTLYLPHSGLCSANNPKGGLV